MLPTIASRPCLLRLLAASLALITLGGCTSPDLAPVDLEQRVRFNNLGTAYLGQQKWSEAEAEFRNGLELSPDSPLLMNNVAVSLVQQGRIDEAEALIGQALGIDPGHLHAHYNQALIEKNRGNFAAAAEHLAQVAAADPTDLLTAYNLGVVLSRVDREEEAEQAFREALRIDPAHVSSLYGLGRFLIQRGDPDEGARLISLSQEIRTRSGLDTAVGTQYGEQGPYAMGQEFPGDAVDPPEPIAVSFRSMARKPASTPRGEQQPTPPWTVLPLAATGRPGILISDGASLHALSDTGVTPVELPETDAIEILALAGADVDNDGIAEAVLMLADETGGRLVLVEQNESGRFSITEDRFGPHGFGPGAESPVSGVLHPVDRDHDGDLDLFGCWVASSGRTGCFVATNDGSSRFDVTASTEHGFEPVSPSEGPLSLGISDIDNDRDIDLLIARPGGIQVLSNQRDGTFEEISERLGITAASPDETGLVLADLDKDGWMDVIRGDATGARLRTRRGGRFEPPVAIGTGGADVRRVVVMDYDNDGFLDVAVASAAGVRFRRNGGAAGWSDSLDLLGETVDGAPSAPLAAFDADGDGDLDLATAGPGATISLWSNEGGNANRWIAVAARGIGDNKFGVGAKVEVLAGALRQKFEITGALELHMGLGSRERADSVRLLWPSGVLQDEIDRDAGGLTEVTQLDRKGTSCPLLYAWRGGRWHFVTDFLGGAAIGYQQAPGRFGTPDTDEYVKIEDGLDPGPDGFLRLRINNQLEEVIWFDQAELLAIDHPAGTELYPDERLMPGPPWPGFRFFVSDRIDPIVSARGVEDGLDLTDLLREKDRRYVENFEQLPFKGYAEIHTLELDLGAFDDRRRSVLLLDGWIDYADSSSNIAAAQAGAELRPPELTIADGRGGWIEFERSMGFPAGLPKTMTVDLTAAFPSSDHRVRIATTMRIHWDRVRLLLGGEGTESQVTRLSPLHAELRFGGFPREVSPDGNKPFGYDPYDVAATASWKAHEGVYTAFGDVTDRVAVIDDRFVTTRNGDEIELRFRDPDPPPPGWNRTYLFFADGFGKDMDPNSAVPSTVGPVPFHEMPSYPYPPGRSPAGRPDESGPYRVVHPSQRGWPGAVPQYLISTRPGGDPES